MLYKDNEGLKLSDTKVKYIRDGVELEQFVSNEGKRWWLDFAEKWDHTEIIEFINVEYTNEQLLRFEEIKSLDSNEETLNNYVIEGVFPTENDRGLRNLQLQKENEKLQQRLADLTEVVLMGGI